MKLIPKPIAVIRARDYRLATDRVYVGWIKRIIKFQNPKDMGAPEITESLRHLAAD